MSANLSSGAASLGKPLARAVLDGIAKPAQRAEAVAALLAAVTLAGADSAVDDTLEIEKVWQEIGKDDSALLNAATAARLAVEEAVNAAQMADLLLTKVLLRGPVRELSASCQIREAQTPRSSRTSEI